MSIQSHLEASLILNEIGDCNSHDQLRRIRTKISQWQCQYADLDVLTNMLLCYQQKREALLSLKVYIPGLAHAAMQYNSN